MPASVEIAIGPAGDSVSAALPERSFLGSDPLARLYRAATSLKLTRSATLYSEGQEGLFVYFVEAGIVRVSRSAESGQRQILAFRVAGDVLGFPDRGRYANTADTVTPARVFQISWPRLQQMMLEDPELQFHLFGKMMRDFRRAQSCIVMLGQQNTCQRLATFLLDLMEVDEVFDAKNSLLQLPISRFDLADFLGTAPKSAARAFAKLENRGLVRRATSRMIEIVDAAGLRTMCAAPRREGRTEFLAGESL